MAVRRRRSGAPRKRSDPGLHEWTLWHVRRTYGRGNWAGKGVLPALKEVTADQAHWRPRPDQHNIAEVALHMAYWKDAVTARLTDRPWKYDDAQNWRTVDPTEDGWSAARVALDAAQRRLVKAIRALPPARLMARGRGPWRLLDYLVDIATHDSYHVGQIFVLRRLSTGRGVGA